MAASERDPVPLTAGAVHAGLPAPDRWPAVTKIGLAVTKPTAAGARFARVSGMRNYARGGVFRARASYPYGTASGRPTLRTEGG